MTPEAILAQPAGLLDEHQRRAFFEQGYLVLPGYVQGTELAGLQAACKELVEASRALSESNPHYELADDHVTEDPHPVLEDLPLDDAPALSGPAGTVVVFDNFMVHGSQANTSRRPRPVMVTGYAAADAFPYTATPAFNALSPDLAGGAGRTGAFCPPRAYRGAGSAGLGSSSVCSAGLAGA